MTETKDRSEKEDPFYRSERKLILPTDNPENVSQLRLGKQVPLSFGQERLWFLNQLEPASTVYNVSGALRIKASLKVATLERSLNEIIRRHDVLRTTFSAVDGEPLQIISSSLNLSLPVVDLTDVSIREREDKARCFARDETRRSFDLARGPLLRATLLRLSEEDHVLLLNMHQIVSDSWSMGLLYRELSVLYKAFLNAQPSSVSDLPIQYGDFAVWQREWLQGEVLEAHLSYWKKQLENVSTLQLPTDRPRPAVQSFRGERQSIEISKELARELKALSCKEGVTLFMTLLAAFQVLLHRYSGQDDIAVGSPISNRNRAEIESLIGFFVNTLVLRNDLSGNPPFMEFLVHVRQVCLDAYAHQDLPFEKLVEELKLEPDLNHSPLFQVMFVFQNAPSTVLEFAGTSLVPIKLETGTAKFDLTLCLREEAEGLKGSLEYSTDLFDTATVVRMLGHFETLLKGIVANPDQRISDLPILTRAERHQLLVEWNDTKKEYPKDKCIHELFEAQAKRTPDFTAVAFENQQLTYRELNHRANRLAHRLRELGVGPNILVGLCVERSIEMIIGILGILKAGGAYVPLDPNYPKDRLAFMLADSAISVLLTQEQWAGGLPPHEASLVFLDRESFRGPADDFQEVDFDSGVKADNLAYMIYTSGSTGRPKGALISHYNVVRLFRATDSWFHFSQDDVWMLLHSYAFDFSVWEMWGALLYGGRLVVVPYWTTRDPEALCSLLRAEGVTVLNQTPSAFRELMLNLVASVPAEKLSLRFVIFGGEALELQSLQRWFDFYGDEQPRLINMYGITETTVHVTYRPITRADVHASVGSVIGKPIPDLLVYVLDQNRKLVPIGVPGEIYVGGAGVARGYHRREELTADRFIPHLFSQETGARLYRTGDLARWLPNGDLEYLGRLDNQVKIRGFRIELGEIEASLNEHPGVQESVVVSTEDKSGDEHLVAYIVPKQQFETAVSDIPWSELQNQQISNWEMLFDETFADARKPEDPTTNTAGVNSSYTNVPIPPAESREWVDHAANRILSLKPNCVLDIGCGLGRTLFRVAPQCKQYWGTDFSQVALDYVEQHLDLLGNQRGVVKLMRARADDFSAIPKSHFDTIVINGVVQYLPHIDHLVKFLESALSAIEPGGVIFVGDVRSLPLLDAFQLSVDLYQAPDALPTDLLWQRVRRNITLDEELVIDPTFFEVLPRSLRRISCVNILLKRGWAQNELTRFRYDVVLYVEPQIQPRQNIPWLDWLKEKLTLGLVRQHLANQPEALGITGVPNARVLPEFRAAASLAKGSQPITAIELRHAIEAIRDETIHPEAFWALENDLPYSVDITWSRTGAEFFDVILRRRSLNGYRRLPASLPEKITTPLPWRSYAHNPIEVKLNQTFRLSLRSLVGKRLPGYMMPSAFVFLDYLPRSPNDKVDRNALSAPQLTGFELEQNFTPPRTPIEKVLAQMWAELLGIEEFGIHANFFNLGGHSLLATRVMSRLQGELQVELPLRTIFEHPTIASLALVITEMQAARAEQTDVLAILAEIESLSEDEAKGLIARNPGAKKI